MRHLSHAEEMSSSHSHIFSPMAPPDTFAETTSGVLCHYTLIFSPLSSFNDIKTLPFPLLSKLISFPAISGLWAEPLLAPRRSQERRNCLNPNFPFFHWNLKFVSKPLVDLFWSKIHYRSQNLKKKPLATTFIEFCRFCGERCYRSVIWRFVVGNVVIHFPPDPCIIKNKESWSHDWFWLKDHLLPPLPRSGTPPTIPGSSKPNVQPSLEHS